MTARASMPLCVLLLACSHPDPTPTHAPPRARDASSDDPRSREPVVLPNTVGVTVARMSTDGGNGPVPLLGGYLRFVNLAQGVGAVRFVAVNAPNYESSHVEAVVEPGASSGYLPARGVPHRVRLEAVTPGAAVPVVAEGSSDVYNGLGCSVVLLGRPVTGRRDAGTEALHLHRLTDLPERGDAGVGLVRFVNGIVGPGAIDLREGEATVYSALEQGSATGTRVLRYGPHRFALAPTDGGTFGEPVEVTLPRDQAHTLWLYGVGPTRAAPGEAHGLLTSDIPPRLSVPGGVR